MIIEFVVVVFVGVLVFGFVWFGVGFDNELVVILVGDLIIVLFGVGLDIVCFLFFRIVLVVVLLVFNCVCFFFEIKFLKSEIKIFLI